MQTFLEEYRTRENRIQHGEHFLNDSVALKGTKALNKYTVVQTGNERLERVHL